MLKRGLCLVSLLYVVWDAHSLRLALTERRYDVTKNRRSVLCEHFPVALALSTLVVPEAGFALVKGSAPPPPRSKQAAPRRKCTNIDECEEIGEERDQETQQLPFETTPEGVRYRDTRPGTASDKGVDVGDVVNIKYRVMRLGKRSSDNLSGEASPVFSLGYGEDDDTANDILTAKVGSGELVKAIDAAIIGLRPGGLRRLFVVPEFGWKKINASCTASSNNALNTGMASAGGLDALGQAVVPLAQVVDNDACIEDTKQPQPRNFGARRRLARRYDEGLLVEIELIQNLGKIN